MSSLIRICLLSIASLITMADAQQSTFQRPDVKTLTTELVMELRVNIGAPVDIGASDAGTRRFIPITGGEFEGKNIKGEVLSGGADWQLTRPDGVTEVKAIYAIKTDDGAVISVDNRGLVDRSGDTPYVRTIPTFKAPAGKYDWLNKRIFTGTITPSSQGFVTIRVFLVN